MSLHFLKLPALTGNLVTSLVIILIESQAINMVWQISSENTKISGGKISEILNKKRPGTAHTGNLIHVFYVLKFKFMFDAYK